MSHQSRAKVWDEHAPAGCFGLLYIELCTIIFIVISAAKYLDHVLYFQ